MALNIIGFNRGQQTTRSNSVSAARDASGSSPASGKSGGGAMKHVQKYLDECRSFYSCIYCRTHLANHDELISRSFQGNRSRAYLFNSVINVSCGPSVQRELNTGSHSVADVFCTNCGTTIGWKYEKAFVDSQRYKEGKYIIELAHVVRENRHLELDKRDIFLGLVTPKQSAPLSKSEGAPTTIAANHQGSLSPASSVGQWSPGTSSASSSSSSSSNEEAAGSRPTCLDRRPRRIDLIDLNGGGGGDDDDDDDEMEDDEMLMFPFYDDLYGNRSSYSNLSTSRSYQKRLRRSIYLDAAPYDWKRASAAGTSSSASVSPTATKASCSSQQHQQRSQLESASANLISCSCSNSIEIPQAGQSQADDNDRQLQAASRRFFASASTPASASSSASSSSSSSAAAAQLGNIPPQPTTSQGPSISGRCDIEKNSEPASSRETSSSSTNSDFAGDDFDEEIYDTQFEFEHDKQPASDPSSFRPKSAGAISGPKCDQSRDSLGECSRSSLGKQSSSSGAAKEGARSGAQSERRPEQSDEDSLASSLSAQSISRTNSLSFDDEEFYDCNTDHNVSNASLRIK